MSVEFVQACLTMGLCPIEGCANEYGFSCIVNGCPGDMHGGAMCQECGHNEAAHVGRPSGSYPCGVSGCRCQDFTPRLAA
jgi:hypothetical protein